MRRELFRLRSLASGTTGMTWHELKIKKSGTWEIGMIIHHPIDDERSLP